MEKNIMQLEENGALIIRLENDQRNINALIKKGNLTYAEKLKNKAADFNKKLIFAFREQFSFCPYYFVYRSETEFIKENKLDSVHFLDNELRIDTSIHCTQKFILTGEIADLIPDTTSHFGGSYYANTENGREKRDSYYTSSEISFEGFIIKDHKFSQLNHPFPFYIKTLSSLPFKRSTDTIIKKLNKNFYRYYKKVTE
jgi:hypothetical protein